MKIPTRFFARVQDLAIQHKAKIWNEAELVTELLTVVDNDARRRDEVRTPLFDEETQHHLFLRDVALWRGADKKFRLIDQQPPDSVAQARAFVSTHTDGMVCCFCRLAEKQVELVKMGHAHIHRQCRRAWFRWVRAAIRENPLGKPHWSDVLGIDRRTAGTKEINAAYKRAAQKAHPDKRGGSAERMQQLNQARDEALASPQARESA